jgi:hypothetical protein
MNDADRRRARHKWEITLHEAAHAAVAAKLGAAPNLAAIWASANGVVRHDDLGAYPTAIIAAAGKIAERLAARFPAPDEEATTSAAISDRAPELTQTVISLCEKAKVGPSDDQAVAIYAIYGRESEPELWLSRVQRVRAEAAALVAQCEPQIVAVARRLYAVGLVGETELKELLSEPPHVASAKPAGPAGTDAG